MQEEKEKTRILFVEDDANLSMILQDYLEMVGYHVDLAKDGEVGFKLFHKNEYDLILLDVMMPKKDGFTLAKEIRARKHNVPIIFLTARNLKEDRIQGFQYGCDDYITKPFSTEELNLRIKAILRRCAAAKMLDAKIDEEFEIGKFTFDSNNLLLKSEEEEKKLTKKESELLKLLCMNKNTLLPREEALEKIWGENDYFIGRSMDVFITKLRKYLNSDPDVKIINVHGIGFKLEIQDKSIEQEHS